MIVSVSVVEDNRKTREMLADLIKSSADLQFVAAYPNGEVALVRAPEEPPDVLLMDLQLAKMTGIECMQQLKPKLPKTKIVVLTQFRDADHIFPALAAGAHGYLLKDGPSGELLKGMVEVVHGLAPISSEIATHLIEYFHRVGRRAPAVELTAREREILELLRLGIPNKEMAHKLGLSVYTIGDHLKNIYEKLHVHNRTAAVTKYFGSG